MRETGQGVNDGQRRYYLKKVYASLVSSMQKYVFFLSTNQFLIEKHRETKQTITSIITTHFLTTTSTNYRPLFAMPLPEADGASRATVSPVWNRAPLQLIPHQRGIKSPAGRQFLCKTLRWISPRASDANWRKDPLGKLPLQFTFRGVPPTHRASSEIHSWKFPVYTERSCSYSRMDGIHIRTRSIAFN